MNQAAVVEFLSKRYGISIPVSPMYGMIETWRAWLEGNVKGFHEYNIVSNLATNTTRRVRRNRTNMLQRAANDWASILLNEKTRIIVDDNASEVWLMGDNDDDDEIGGVFGENSFWRCANELVSTSRWAGTAAFELFVRGSEVTEKSGNLVGGSGVGVNFLCADQIIPISHENGQLKEAAFVSDKTIDGEDCQFVSVHKIADDGLYEISSFYLDSAGKLMHVEGSGLTVHTGSPVPWFALIRKSGPNIFDYNSPFGVSIISGAEDVLKALDSAFDNFVNDFQLGRKMVFMNRSMFGADNAAPQETGESLFITVGDKLTEKSSLMQEYNPALRTSENAEGVQKALDMFSLMVGLGAHHYQFDHGSIKTATEYVGERQDMVQNAYREMIGIKEALKTTTKAMLWIGRNILGQPVNPDAKITIQADDSYIIDSEAEKAEWREDISLGLRSKTEYRMRFYGETEEEAAAAIAKVKAESPSISDLLGE